MSIGHYVKKGIVFKPETLSDMSKALEATTAALGIEGEAKRRTVAKFIIRLAQDEKGLDAAALCDRSLAALGGDAYRVPRSRAVAAPAPNDVSKNPPLGGHSALMRGDEPSE